MNKKLFVTVLMAFSLSFFLSAQNVKTELLGYISKEITKFGDIERKASEAYTSVTGDNYKDDNTTYTTITKTVIPTYSKMIDKLKAISTSLKTKEMQALNDIYLTAAKIQLNAFNMVASGIKEGNKDVVLLANKKHERVNRILNEWEGELTELCQYYGVPLD